MNAIIYSRVSTDEQAETGHSIETQIVLCERFARENGYIVTGIYRDLGKSATNMNRPGLQDMLIRCEGDTSIDFVLVQDTDRIARSVNDHFTIKATLRKLSVSIISVSQPSLSGDSPENQFVDTVVAGMNAFQSQLTSRKVSKVLEQKAENGWWPGLAPLGYLNKTIDGQNIIIVDKVRSKFIIRAFELYSHGNISLRHLNDELKDLGFRTRTDSFILETTFNNCLKNLFYTGKIKYNKKIYQGKHIPLISEELFERCQLIRKIHTQTGSRIRKHQFLLNGHIFCSKCKKRLFSEQHLRNGTINYYYFCKSRCGQPYAPLSQIENDVKQMVKTLEIPQHIVDSVITKASQIIYKSSDELISEHSLRTKRIKQINRRRENLETKLLDDIITNDTYKRQSAILDVELQRLNRSEVSTSKSEQNNLNTMERLLLIAKNLSSAYSAADYLGKRQLLTLFFENIEVDQRRVSQWTVSKLFSSVTSSELIKNGSVRISNTRGS